MEVGDAIMSSKASLQAKMGFKRRWIDRFIGPLIAVIGGEAQPVAREIGQGFVDRVGMEEQRIAGREVRRVPDCLGWIDRHTATTDRARMMHGVVKEAACV